MGKSRFLKEAHLITTNTSDMNSIVFTRSSLKHKANQQHEEEKDYMVTLQAVGVETGSYDGDSALPSQVQPEGTEDIHSYDQNDNDKC